MNEVIVPKKKVGRAKKAADETPTATRLEDKPTCMICLSPFNKVEHTKISCPFCHKDACRRCIQTFICTTTNDPHCMHCSRAFEKEFVDDNLTATFRMGDYRKHRENILLDREVALLPATQYRAQQIREADRMEKELFPPLEVQLKDLYRQVSALNHKIYEISTQKSQIHTQIHQMRTGTIKQDKREITFVRKCPDPECRGFLSTAWKCGLCSKWACAECHEIKGTTKDAEHTCKPENVATAKLLAKDSRPCPGCGTIITKIEGCDQMWCPQCHVAFSWKTGQKETGVIHNPHFYEWQRRQNGGVAPRVAGDMACGGIPHYTQFRATLTNLAADEISALLEFHRVIIHTQHYELTRYHNAFNPLDNEELRIQYLLGNITQDELKVTVQKLERKREKERAMRRVLEVLVQAGTDIIRRIMSESDPKKKREIIKEVAGLRTYINELFEKIHLRMKLSVPQYKPNWGLHYPFSPTAKKLAAAKEKKATVPTPAAPTGVDVQDTESTDTEV